jgi:hypothetical protein
MTRAWAKSLSAASLVSRRALVGPASARRPRRRRLAGPCRGTGPRTLLATSRCCRTPKAYSATGARGSPLPTCSDSYPREPSLSPVLNWVSSTSSTAACRSVVDTLSEACSRRQNSDSPFAAALRLCGLSQGPAVDDICTTLRAQNPGTPGWRLQITVDLRGCHARGGSRI